MSKPRSTYQPPSSIERVKLKCEHCDKTCVEGRVDGDVPRGWSLKWTGQKFIYFCPDHKNKD